MAQHPASSSPVIGARGVFGFDLNKPLRGGWMLKQGGSHKAFKKRFFVLYPGFLVYYSSPDKYKYDVARSTLASRIFAIKLKGAEIHTAKYPPKGCHFGLTVYAPDPLNKRCGYLFNATDKEDRKGWILALRGATGTPHKPRADSADAPIAQNGGSDHQEQKKTDLGGTKSDLQEAKSSAQEPTSDPQEPTNDPQEPASDPQEPTSDPQEPTSDPQEPTSGPREPTSDPREPTNDPQEPASDPQEPECAPQKPKIVLEEPNTDHQEPESAPQEQSNGFSNGQGSPTALIRVHLTLPDDDLGAVTDDEGDEHRAEPGQLVFSDGEDSEEELGPSPRPSPKHSPELPRMAIADELNSSDSESSADSPHPVSPPIPKENTPTDEVVEEGEEEEEAAGQLEPPKKRSQKRPSLAFTGKQGWLYKQGGKHKNWKQRYFVLSSGIFAYYKSKGGKLQGEVKLKNMQIFFPATGEREQSYQFTVHTESSWNKRNNYVVAASTEHEMKDWIEAFKLASQRPGQPSPTPNRK